MNHYFKNLFPFLYFSHTFFGGVSQQCANILKIELSPETVKHVFQAIFFVFLWVFDYGFLWIFLWIFTSFRSIDFCNMHNLLHIKPHNASYNPLIVNQPAELNEFTSQL